MNKFVCFIVFFLFIFSGSQIFANENLVRKPLVVTFYDENIDESVALDLVKNALKEEYSAEIDFVDLNINETDCDFIYLKDRYNINKAPTILFINPNKKITKKISEYIPYSIFKKNIVSIQND